MSSVAICGICFEDTRLIFEDLQSISACGHVFHSPCLQQWMENCPAGRDLTCPSCKPAISSIYEKIKELESQVAVMLQWAETAEAATLVASSELARFRQDLTRIQEELMYYSLELEKVGEEIRAMRRSSLWNRFFRAIRVLREDRENWPWNLLKVYVLKLVELAKLGHNVWTS